MDNLLIVLLYNIIVLVSVIMICFINKINTRYKIIVFIIISTLFGLFSAYIFPVFSDRLNYVLWFEKLYKNFTITFSSVLDNNFGQEVGFIIYNKILFSINSSYKFMFFVFSFLPIFTTLVYLDKWKLTPSNTYTYFALVISYIPFFSFYLCKQMTALIFVEMGLHQLIKKDNYFLFIIIACLFHMSACILLLVPFAIRYINSLKKIKLLILSSCIGVFFMNSIIDLVFNNIPILKQNLAYVDYGINVGVGFKGIPILLIVIFFMKSSSLHIDFKYLIFLTLSGLSFVLSIPSYWVYRFYIYFFIAALPIFSYLRIVNINKKNKISNLNMLLIINYIMVIREIVIILG